MVCRCLAQRVQQRQRHSPLPGLATFCSVLHSLSLSLRLSLGVCLASSALIVCSYLRMYTFPDIYTPQARLARPLSTNGYSMIE